MRAGRPPSCGGAMVRGGTTSDGGEAGTKQPHLGVRRDALVLVERPRGRVGWRLADGGASQVRQRAGREGRRRNPVRSGPLATVARRAPRSLCLALLPAPSARGDAAAAAPRRGSALGRACEGTRRTRAQLVPERAHTNSGRHRTLGDPHVHPALPGAHSRAQRTAVSSSIVTAGRLPIQTRFGWALDGDGWAFGWEWMGVSAQPTRFWMGYGWGFGWAFPGDGVVPSSALEYHNSSGPPEEQHVILGRRGRFSFRNPKVKRLCMMIGCC